MAHRERIIGLRPETKDPAPVGVATAVEYQQKGGGCDLNSHDCPLDTPLPTN